MTDEKADSPVPLFVPTFDVEACLAQLRECLERGWTGMGWKTIEFEKAWCVYTGLANSVFLNSATAALDLAVLLLGLRDKWAPGDEIITTPLTFVSTNHAILHAGYTPVFADVDDQLCLDPVSVAGRITERTRAVMFVGMGGNVGQLEAVRKLCVAHDLRMILDAAHMAGTRWVETGQHVGEFVDAAIFSFQAVKNLPTGDAGMLCFEDSGLDTQARKLSWLGISKSTYDRTLQPGTYKWEYDVEYPGFKAHGNALMAAIALAQLPHLDRDNAYRRMIAERYERELTDLAGVRPISHSASCESARHLFQVEVQGDRNAAMMYLNSCGIHAGVHYKSNASYKMYASMPGAGDLPVASRLSESIISLPLHLRMQVADVDRVIDAVYRGVAR